MKLYIWNNPYKINYGNSCLYVLANSLKEAKELAKKATVARFGTIAHKEDTISLSSLGKPDRIINKPYAELYEWSE